jgi:hypothetical protein
MLVFAVVEKVTILLSFFLSFFHSFFLSFSYPPLPALPIVAGHSGDINTIAPHRSFPDHNRLNTMRHISGQTE